MLRFKAIGAALGMLLLGACTTNYIDDQLGSVEREPGQGSAYAQALHKDYSALARTLQQGGHLSDALFWNAKSARAARGEEVAPEDPEVWGLQPEDLVFAKRGEARLKAQLATDARTRDPATLAQAQTSFDCVVVHSGTKAYFNAPGTPANPKDVRDLCRDRFETAMQALEKVGPKPAAEMAPDFWVFFAFGKSTLSAEARHTLDTVVTYINGKTKLPAVTVTGHADTVGSAKANKALSDKRAEAAAMYMVEHGVPTNIITQIGKGKTDLRVPTPDNVKNQENRNVHIELK
jgi:outer membrane protein OmpA-like peptidoglycan-associated protein